MSKSNKKINFMSCSAATFFQFYDTDSKVNYFEQEREYCPVCGKTKYSYNECMNIMRSIKKGKENRSRNTLFLRAYKCNGSWHITSAKTEKGQRKLHYAA